MRPRRLAAVFALVAASCSSSVESTGLAINDPLALIDDIDGPLRLYVLPGAAFTCDPSTGMVSPAVPDLPEGMFLEAIADLSLTVMSSRATASLEVPEGEYTVLVRGKGTDPVTMITNTFIATACSASTIENGQTREVRLTLLPITGTGVCGDPVRSPDEQCDDGNTTDGDGCSAACRTERFIVNTTTASVQNHPAVAGAVGQNWNATYDSGNMTVLLRTLAPDGSTITSPSILAMDADLATVLTDPAFGARLLADVAVATNGRIGIAFVSFGGGGPDVRVAFFGSNRVPENGGASVLVGDGMTGSPATNPSVAFAGDGTLMVVYEDMASSTGLSGATFASGAFTANGPFEVGAGLMRAASPDVAGTSDGFVVAMTAGGDVHFQRFGADGTARDAAAVVASAGAGAQDAPAVGAQPGGDFLVAWRDELADGSGTGIGARAFAADGTPRQDPFVLNTTTGGAQSQPSIASGSTFAVAFISEGGARARRLSGSGDPLPNFEGPPTTDDFEIAASATEVVAAAGGTDTNPVWMAVTNDDDDIYARFFPLP